jgi:hypothetical protein
VEILATLQVSGSRIRNPTDFSLGPLTDMGRPSSVTSLARPMPALNSDESVFALHASADLLNAEVP